MISAALNHHLYYFHTPSQMSAEKGTNPHHQKVTKTKILFSVPFLFRSRFIISKSAARSTTTRQNEPACTINDGHLALIHTTTVAGQAERRKR